jgi:hypothetical protein
MGRRYQADTDFQHTMNEINKTQASMSSFACANAKDTKSIGRGQSRKQGEESITLYKNYIILSCLFVQIVNYITL